MNFRADVRIFLLLRCCRRQRTMHIKVTQYAAPTVQPNATVERKGETKRPTFLSFPSEKIDTE